MVSFKKEALAIKNFNRIFKIIYSSIKISPCLWIINQDYEDCFYILYKVIILFLPIKHFWIVNSKIKLKYNRCNHLEVSNVIDSKLSYYFRKTFNKAVTFSRHRLISYKGCQHVKKLQGHTINMELLTDTLNPNMKQHVSTKKGSPLIWRPVMTEPMHS